MLNERRTHISESENKESLSYERAKGLVIEGFKFSQGSNNLLRLTWAWVHNNFPGYKLSTDDRVRLKQDLQPALEKFLNPKPGGKQAHVPYQEATLVTSTGARVSVRTGFDAEGVSSALDRSLPRFQQVLNNPHNLSLEDMVEHNILELEESEKESFLKDKNNVTDAISKMTISRDHYFLVTKGQRPTQTGDKFASFICQFALSDNRKHSPYFEYDNSSQKFRAF
jgi:hypothetical protein